MPRMLDLSPEDLKSLTAKVLKVSSKKINKAKSPAIEAFVKGIKHLATIDEGAEISILSEKLSKQAGIEFRSTPEQCNGAGGSGLQVVGQTNQRLVVTLMFQGNPISVDLGYVVVVRNLEADLLIGEPGKAMIKMHTVPEESKIYIKKDGKTYSTPYIKKSHGNYTTVKLVKNGTVEPGESVRIVLPPNLAEEEAVLISARREDEPWFDPAIRRVDRGCVNVVNTSDEVVTLSRGKVFAEARAAESHNLRDLVNNTARQVIDIPDDGFRYKNFRKTPKTESFIKDVQLDPDNRMPGEWKQKFADLLQEYDEIIDPFPGKYNGIYGDSDTSLNFAQKPPVTEKVYTPKYTPELTKELGKKMDTLIEMGVLVKPEEIGVTVENVHPSMLVPKGDGDGFRFVTDLSRMNTFVKKLPTSSPSIQDAKNAIARYPLHVHCDLSNYFYQGGVTRQDAQHLGVLHPFKGLYTYCVEAQGGKNCGEHAYERLALIFGDMIRDERMTRHADGLHVLGRDWESLFENLKEVLFRVKRSGLTLKPSKLIIAPKSTVLFGWRLEGTKWLPTAHTTSALAQAARPTTVKKMRSFVGAWKQFSELVPGYAALLKPLELVAAGKQSSDKITWTPELEQAFEMAKEATNNLEAVHTPNPDDILHTYSDYAEDTRAVGGKMVIERIVDGKKQYLLAGYFSQVLDKFKKRWLPCEGESCGIKLVLNHFAPWIRENKNRTIHHTDNQPSVQAWKRLKRGAFSTSSRIMSFLVGLSELTVDLEYTPGKSMHTSDFFSRNPVKCDQPEVCQICRFAEKVQVVGDKSSLIRVISAQDVIAGNQILPLTQINAWKSIQEKNSVHQKLKHLIAIGQTPNKHKTCGEHTILKNLHSLFVKGDLILSKEGVVLVKAKNGAHGGFAISVPNEMLPGLVHTLHIRLQHPSKAQLSAVIQRHFYARGWQAIVDRVCDSCLQCASLKPIPHTLLQGTTTKIEGFGTRFSTDVHVRAKQKILFVRENLTQFTWAEVIPDEKADTMETAILSMILPFVPDAGAVLRTDGATAFQSLEGKSDSELAKHNITLEVGRLLNANKNPTAENMIKEFEKEFLRYDKDRKTVRRIDLISVLKLMNTRIRYQGLSSQEMFTRRGMFENTEIKTTDKQLSSLQYENRMKQSEYQAKHLERSRQPAETTPFHVGDFVFVKHAKDKLNARELHVVDQITMVGKQKFVVVRKAEDQLRAKTYLVREEELYRAPLFNNTDSPSHAQRPLLAPGSPAQREEIPGAPLDQPQHGDDEALHGSSGAQSQVSTGLVNDSAANSSHSEESQKKKRGLLRKQAAAEQLERLKNSLMTDQRPLLAPGSSAQREEIPGALLDQPQHGIDEALHGSSGAQSQVNINFDKSSATNSLHSERKRGRPSKQAAADRLEKLKESITETEEDHGRRRPTRMSAKKAMDLFTKVLEIVSSKVKKKKREVNPYISDPYDSDDENSFIEYDGYSKVNHRPAAAAVLPRQQADDDDPTSESLETSESTDSNDLTLSKEEEEGEIERNKKSKKEVEDDDVEGSQLSEEDLEPEFEQNIESYADDEGASYNPRVSSPSSQPQQELDNIMGISIPSKSSFGTRQDLSEAIFLVNKVINPGPDLPVRSTAPLAPPCDRSLRPRTFSKGHYKDLNTGRKASK